MIKVILCGHGNLAEAMKQSITMIYGQCDEIDTLTFNPDENSASLVKKMTAKLDHTAQTLIVVDLFGGSPFNAASEVAIRSPAIEVIAGMSLPLCLAMITHLEQYELSQLVDYLVDVGNNSVIALNKALITDDLEELL